MHSVKLMKVSKSGHFFKSSICGYCSYSLVTYLILHEIWSVINSLKKNVTSQIIRWKLKSAFTEIEGLL